MKADRMITDRQANPLSGANAQAQALFDEGCEAFATYCGDPIALFDAAIEASPSCVMAHLARAWCLTLATEPAAAQMAREGLAGIAGIAARDERARGHYAALGAALSGEWATAARTLERHSLDHPRDLIALQAGHLLDFLQADARTLRFRIARALPHWEGVPGQSLLLGMLAFGLEEAGAYPQAEEAGRAAIDANPRDCWAHHAVAHVMEMQGRASDGVQWIESRAEHWAGEDNFLKTHNHWHLALCHIELGEPERALALYDARIAGGVTAADLVDQSALLWRLHLSGMDVADRFAQVAGLWEAHADGALYPFNDVHAVMAWLGAGQMEKVSDLRDRMFAATGSQTARWIHETGLPLIDGLTAFHQQRWDEAVDQLWPARHIVNRFGGSHAQRDVFDLTLIEASLRGGHTRIAEGLARERLSTRPHSPVNLAFANRARGLSQAPAKAS